MGRSPRDHSKMSPRFRVAKISGATALPQQPLHPTISKTKSSELHRLGTFCTTFFYFFFFPALCSQVTQSKPLNDRKSCKLPSLTNDILRYTLG